MKTSPTFPCSLLPGYKANSCLLFAQSTALGALGGQEALCPIDNIIKLIKKTKL